MELPLLGATAETGEAASTVYLGSIYLSQNMMRICKPSPSVLLAISVK
jgi:hypothetical protein